jgi:hypothetical protein
VRASENPVVGRWRIVEADLWDRDHLDLCGPATLVVQASGHGEIAFGAMQASLDIDYGPDEIGFTWAGFDEMDEVSGTGSAELRDDGSLQIEFEYHLGDEAILKAVRDPSSTPCWTPLPCPPVCGA